MEFVSLSFTNKTLQPYICRDSSTGDLSNGECQSNVFLRPLTLSYVHVLMLYAYHQPHSADKIHLDSQATRHETYRMNTSFHLFFITADSVGCRLIPRRYIVCSSQLIQCFSIKQ